MTSDGELTLRFVFFSELSYFSVSPCLCVKNLLRTILMVLELCTACTIRMVRYKSKQMRSLILNS